MGTVYYKTGGSWVEPQRVYVKRNGVWTQVERVYVKDAGVWKETFVWDTTPPDVPLVSLQLVDTSYWEDGTKKSGRHIKIGVRQPLNAHDTDLRRIRVLTTHKDKRPSSQYGGRFIEQPDDNYKNEPWSEFYFNGYRGSNPGKSSAEYQYKTFPPSANNSSQVGGQKFHYFSAWAEDWNGNWSAVNPAEIWVPKRNVDGSDLIVKEARFQVTDTGSWGNAGFATGPLKQSSNPFSNGLWFYNAQLTSKIGSQGAPNIRSASIYIPRRDDNGRGEADITIFTHKYANSSDLPAPGNLTRDNIKHLGTLGKGEGKWFKLPDGIVADIESGNVKGFGLRQAKPNTTSSAKDYSVVKSMDEQLRTGEIHVVWTESP